MRCSYSAAVEASANPMTRCECAEVSFAEAVRRIQAERLTLDEVARRTGCGATCTACVPDLERFLGVEAAY